MSTDWLYDPVVVYDLLLEARARLVGAYNAAVEDDDVFVACVLEIDERIERVSLVDLSSQRELARSFNAEIVELRRMGRHL
jgi:hypothetical protein